MGKRGRRGVVEFDILELEWTFPLTLAAGAPARDRLVIYAFFEIFDQFFVVEGVWIPFGHILFQDGRVFALQDGPDALANLVELHLTHPSTLNPRPISSSKKTHFIFGARQSSIAGHPVDLRAAARRSGQYRAVPRTGLESQKCHSASQKCHSASQKCHSASPALRRRVSRRMPKVS